MLSMIFERKKDEKIRKASLPLTKNNIRNERFHAEIYKALYK